MQILFCSFKYNWTRLFVTSEGMDGTYTTYCCVNMSMRQIVWHIHATDLDLRGTLGCILTHKRHLHASHHSLDDEA